MTNLSKDVEKRRVCRMHWEINMHSVFYLGNFKGIEYLRDYIKSCLGVYICVCVYIYIYIYIYTCLNHIYLADDGTGLNMETSSRDPLKCVEFCDYKGDYQLINDPGVRSYINL
jgi:hypothetical protein